MGAVKKTVPINVNIYLPKTTYNPNIRNATSYANLSVKTLTENASLASPNSIADSLAVGTWTDLPGDTTAWSYKPLAGSLTHGDEHEVFTLVFTANTGYHFDSGGRNLVKKRIVSRYPKAAENVRDFSKDSESTASENYASRWRFVETPSNFDDNKLAKTVTVVAHYTAPDFRAPDALKYDGTYITNTEEILKNRGIIMVPMLRKSTTALTAKISGIHFLNTRDAFNGEETITISDSISKKKSSALILGTPSATGTLIGSQEASLDFGPIIEDFTIPSNGRAIVDFRLPNTANDEFQFYINSSVSLDSSIPTQGAPKSIFKYDLIDIKIIASQTGTSFHGSSPGFTAQSVITGRALTDIRKGSSGAFGTVSANHATLPNKIQGSGIYHAFSLQINPLASSGADDLVVIDTNIGDGGFLNKIKLSEDGSSTGTLATLKKVKLVQSSANVLIVGYVFLRKIGKSDVTLTLPVNKFLTVA